MGKRESASSRPSRRWRINTQITGQALERGSSDWCVHPFRAFGALAQVSIHSRTPPDALEIPPGVISGHPGDGQISARSNQRLQIVVPLWFCQREPPLLRTSVQVYRCTCRLPIKKPLHVLNGCRAPDGGLFCLRIQTHPPLPYNGDGAAPGTSKILRGAQKRKQPTPALPW